MKRSRLIYLLVLAAVLIGAGIVIALWERESGGVAEDVVRDNTLGTAYLGQQEWDKAAAAFERALSARPDDPLLLNNLAVALMQSGDPDRAETYLRRAVEADPAFPYAHYNLGLIEADRGRFEEAAARFERVAEADPDDVHVQYNLGRAYAGLGRAEPAEAALRHALAIDPDHVSSLYALGRQLVVAGRVDEGRQMIARSQQVRARSGLDAGVGSGYGEQGRYATGVEYPGDVIAAPDGIRVSFRLLERGDARGPWTLSRRSPDGRPVVVVAGARSPAASGPGSLIQRLPDHPAGARVLALAAGDGDDDGTVELYALVIAQDRSLRPAVVEQDESGALAWSGRRRFPDPALAPAGVRAADLTLVDLDHDGDLDLFYCWSPSSESGCAIATNDGSGSFALRPSSAHGFDIRFGSADRVRVAFSDLDNDRDIDLIVAEPGGIHLLSNMRDGSFASTGDVSGLGGRAAGLRDLALADFNKDGWMDMVVGADDGLRLFVNRGGRFDPPVAVADLSVAVNTVAVLDADNDGFLDLAVSGADGSARAFRNIGGGWRPVAGWLADAPDAAPVAGFDADGDGDVDLVSAGPGGVALLRNDGGNAHHWVSVESHGVGDNRYGIGAKIEVLSGGLRQKFEVAAPLPVHAGLGGRSTVDAIRHLWPSGVLQDEIRLAAGETVRVTQLDRKGTSCPLLYVWRDGGWQFVTDFLGGSAIGYRHAPGVLNTPDTDEYIKLEQAPEVDDQGLLRIRVNNQLQEIIWFDQIELLAVDHPQGTALFPNERLMPGPPWPAFELFISEDLRPVAAARDPADGTDLGRALAERDRSYAGNFSLLPFKGYAEAHTLELDLGRFDNRDRIVLLLDGWIDYADSTANVAAHQAGLALEPPALTVADGRGGWRDTGHLMGFPAGLPKTMAVDLSGLFASSDHRVRITTNMRIYWDRARSLVGGAGTAHQIRRLSPLKAELRYGGFPRETSSDGRPPFAYDPRQVSMTPPWKAHVGRYTAFGDVSMLLNDLDDRMVTTRSGDEIELVFRSPGRVPAGQTRTYLLFADGFGKDMDPNSAANGAVGPMPFHGMPTYPYAAEVVHPHVDMLSDAPTRWVPDSDRGWPGALPLILAPEANPMPSARSDSKARVGVAAR